MDSFRTFINNEIQCEGFKAYDASVFHWYNQGVPISEIKKGANLSTGGIYRSLKRCGIEPKRRKKEFYNAIKYFGQSGLSLQKISEITGYSVRQIRNILKTGNPNG